MMRSYCFFAPLTPCRSLFLSTRKDRLSKSNRPTLVFSFFFVWEIYCRNRRCIFWFDRICRVQFFFPVFIRTCSTLHLDLVRMPSAGSLGVLRECHLTSVPWSEVDVLFFQDGINQNHWSCAGNKLRNFQMSMQNWVVLFKLGKMNPFWRAYFSNGLVQPPTSQVFNGFKKSYQGCKPWTSSPGNCLNVYIPGIA